MEFLEPYLKDVGSLLTWLSKIETNITALQVVQGVAAFLGIILSTLGIVKAWRYAEKRLGKRLEEFLDAQEDKISAARQSLQIAQKRRSFGQDGPTALPTRRDLKVALEPLGTSLLFSSKRALNSALKRTTDREDLANKKRDLHAKQKAMVHLLLGAVASSQNDHDGARRNFNAALLIDDHDVEAIEYLGFEYLRTDDGDQALVQFEKLEKIARARGDALLVSKALRNCGLAQLKPPNLSHHNANLAYLNAIREFPSTGPALELALIHELRGMTNLRPSRMKLATKCFEQAQLGYSALRRGWNRDAAAARSGLKRIKAANLALRMLHAEAESTRANDDDDETSNVDTSIASQPRLPLSQQQPAQQPPDGERAN